MIILRKRYPKQLLVSAFLMLIFNIVTFSQQRTVSGTVTSNPDGLPLIGVNVIIQGTSTGTITDLEGHYSIDVSGGEISLQFSFVGYEAKTISVGSSTNIDVQLLPSFLELDEVVITSLGIPREKKRITYAAQNVGTEDLSRARELNVANSLQGKVAGMDVIKSSAGVGSATRVVLRGIRSISGNNQPLYIVDGVPIQNFTWSSPQKESSWWTAVDEGGGEQSPDGISDINPDDIATVTVLKGPNATALYGARANNGAVVITTRKGISRKGIGVEFRSNMSIDKALILNKFQYVYGQGNNGVYVKNSGEGWGAKMEGQMVDHWSPDPNFTGPAQYAYLPHNNFEKFFRTGYNVVNTLALTSGSDKIRTLFSYTNTISQGIVENNRLRRNNFNLRIDGNLSPKFSFDTKLTYFTEQIDNRLVTGSNFNNILSKIYGQPSNISLEQAKQYEYFDESGTRRQHGWLINGGGNPYWMLNRNIRADERNRIIGMASLRYSFTENLSLMVRSSFDKLFDNYFNKIYNRSDNHLNGHYEIYNRNSLEWNNDFLLNYNKISEFFSIDLSFGGNMLSMSSTDIGTWTVTGLLKPDLFVITNTSKIGAAQFGKEKEVHSLYGFATIGIKDFLFIDITGRNDWSSTLPKDNWSYFYPSVGLTWILTDMFEHTPDFLTFTKVRASFAQVGNDTEPYVIHKTYSYVAGGQLGYAWRNTVLPAEALKPENTNSIELGFDLRLFRNRLGVDFTWYKSNTFNQLISVPLPRASGYTYKFINAGNMQNKGVEIIMNARPLLLGDFSWDFVVNFAKNNNICIELSDELTEYSLSDLSNSTRVKVVEGERYGKIYTRGFVRNDAGRILINDLGLPVTTPGMTVPVGDANPDWIGGLSNNFKWKGISLNILVDSRMGGDVFSFTEAALTGSGYSEATLEGRDGMIVDGVVDVQDYDQNPDGDPIYEENTIETTAESYWKSLGGRSPVIAEPYRYDASYIRVREVLLGYIWNLKTSLIQSIDFSLYGRNLGFLYNASGIIDPNMSVSVANIQGLEARSIPSSRTYGVNLRFKF